MLIRTATPLDISALYGMLHVMHSETVHDVSPVRSDKMVAAISRAIHDGVVLVAEIDGRIIGSIGGAEMTDWWSDKKHLADKWFFVYRQHRKSTIATRLIKKFMKIGQEAGVPVKLGHVYSGDIDRKDKFYERLGLCKVGSLFTEA